MSKERWIWRCEHVLPTDMAAGRRIMEKVLDELRSLRWGERDIFGIHLATEEALVNAIVHGNRFDPEKHVQVCCRISPKVVHIEITDQGEGFDAETVPDPTDPTRLDTPSGRGVMLMRAFMSRVDYNATGNSVVLEKERGEPG